MSRADGNPMTDEASRAAARQRAHELLGWSAPDSPAHSAGAGEYAGVKFGPKTDLHFDEETRGQCDRITAELLSLRTANAALEAERNAAWEQSDARHDALCAERRAHDGSRARAAALEAERDGLRALLDAPEILDFVKAVQLEAAHQRKRWGSDHDSGKTDADWFWLIGYLGGKALHNPAPFDPPGHRKQQQEKQLHRIITVAAAAANWHAQKLGATNMRPGIETPAGEAP